MAVGFTEINVAKIEDMQQSIKDWKKEIKSAKITNASKDAIKSIKTKEKQKEVKSLCQACDSYTNDLIKKLEEFKTRLTEIKKAYENNS